MEIFSYVPYNTIKYLPPPPPALRRCWATAGHMEDCSVVCYNKKQLVKELNMLFAHVQYMKKKHISAVYRAHGTQRQKMHPHELGEHVKHMIDERIMGYAFGV